MNGKELLEMLKTFKSPLEVSWEKGKVRFVKMQFIGSMEDEQFLRLCDEIMSGKYYGAMKIEENHTTGQVVVFWERRVQERAKKSDKTKN